MVDFTINCKNIYYYLNCNYIFLLIFIVGTTRNVILNCEFNPVANLQVFLNWNIMELQIIWVALSIGTTENGLNFLNFLYSPSSDIYIS